MDRTVGLWYNSADLTMSRYLAARYLLAESSPYRRVHPGLRQLCTSSAAAKHGSSGGSGADASDAANAADAAAAAAAAGAARASNPSGSRKQKATPLSDTISKWVGRGLLTATGAAAAGVGALYITDPEGTREMAYAAAKDIDERIKFFTEPSREQLLPDPVPAFPGALPGRTLVIELDTLVHSSYDRQYGWRVAKRPGADAFLAYMSSFYEVVVFTSCLNTYADPILNKLDPNKNIAYRLYRPETKYEAGVHVKDLSHLNRDLSRVVVVDDDVKHVKHQPENALLVPKWSDDTTDTALLDLVPFLEGLVQEDVADVRNELVTLQGKALNDGLAEHKALASSRSGRTTGGRGSLFGAAAGPAGAVRGPASSTIDGSAETREGGEDSSAADGANGSSLWGQVSSKSRTLFRPTGGTPVSEVDGENASKP